MVGEIARESAMALERAAVRALRVSPAPELFEPDVVVTARAMLARLSEATQLVEDRTHRPLV
jgi:hypothetical protein